VLTAGVGTRLRVEPPDLFAGGRLQRRHVLVLGAQIEHAVDHQRRHFERGLGGVVVPFRIAGVVAPDLFKPGDPAP